MTAARFGWKPSCSAAASTRLRVSARSVPRPLSALDTVPVDTPASWATSAMVVGRPRPSVAESFREDIPAQYPDVCAWRTIPLLPLGNKVLDVALGRV
ncbi:hypothetical protein GCM10018954_088600 [Kutzneria kofuensis]